MGWVTGARNSVWIMLGTPDSDVVGEVVEGRRRRTSGFSARSSASESWSSTATSSPRYDEILEWEKSWGRELSFSRIEEKEERESRSGVAGRRCWWSCWWSTMVK